MPDVTDSPEKIDKAVFNRIEDIKTKLSKDMSNWDIGHGCSIWASPVIDRDKIYFGSCNDYIYCLNKKDGSLVWKQATGGPVVSSPFIHANVLYEGSYDKHMYALDAKTGDIIWKSRIGNVIPGSATFYKNKVYFGGLDNYFYCVDASDGSLVWKFYCSGGSAASPLIFNGNVLFPSYDKYLNCLNAETGEVVWKFLMNSKAGVSPAIMDEKGNLVMNFINREPVRGIKNCSILESDYEGKIFILSLDGEKKSSFRACDWGTSSILPANNGLYFTSFDNNIYFSSSEGKMWWRYTTGQSVEAVPVIINNVLYCGSGDQNMYALDAKTGMLKWAFHTAGIVASTIAHSDNIIYFGSWDGNMYAIDTEKKVKLWSFLTGGLGQAPLLGIDMNIERERIRFAISTGMNKDMAYKTQSDEAHDRVEFAYIKDDEKNPYLMIGKDNPYVNRRKRE
ncbi:MAG: PQQ-binding-like beta-propeller repeat protein [Candidatus Aenigmatarchaeota archaeon]